MNGNTKIPPPPPGFVLEEERPSRMAVPSPPPGFVLEPMESDAPRLSQATMPADDSLSQLRTMAGGLLEGIPVVGPMIRGGVERAAAGTLAALSPDKEYPEVLKMIQEGTDAEKQANPWLDTGAQVAGAVGGTIPMVMAAPGLFGAGGGSLLARSLASGATGVGLGGADAAVRSGGDPNAILSGAEWGFGLGLAGPVAGQLAGAGTRALASRFLPGGASKAQQAFGRAAGADAVDDIGTRLAQMGDDAMPMDLGPNLQRQAGALAATPGRGQEIVRSAIGTRDAGANRRIIGALDNTLGPAPVPTQVDDAIRANQQALGPAYEDVFQNARAVNTEPIAHNLEAMATRLRGDAQRVVQRVRQMLNVTGTDQLDPNPYTLFQTRQAIDGMMDGITDGNARAQLTIARQQINRELNRAVPGIRRVDARFEELARQREAFGRGQQALDSGRTAPRPAELADEFQRSAIAPDQMVGPSGVPVRLRQGARAEIERIVGTNANDRVALQRLIKGEGDWNRERLATLFGRERADRILRVLDSERAYAETSNIVTRNSETAARQAAQADIGAAGRQPGVLQEAGNLNFGTATLRMGDKLIGGARNAAQERVNEELARLLTSRDPAMVTNAIRMVQAAQRRGDISAQRAKEIIQGVTLGASQRRRPLEITVTPSR